MNTPLIALLGFSAGTLGAGLVHAQPSVVVPSSGRLQEALVLQDSIRRTERNQWQVQSDQNWSSMDVYALSALHGVTTLEQMDHYLIRANRERALRQSRNESLLAGPYVAPDRTTSLDQAVKRDVLPQEAQPAEALTNEGGGDHEELYRLNQRVARYEESTLEALRAERAPDKRLLDERLEVVDRRNELARKLGVSPAESAPPSSASQRVENLTREIEAWTKLLRGTGVVDRPTAEKARTTALQELDLLAPQARK